MALIPMESVMVKIELDDVDGQPFSRYLELHPLEISGIEAGTGNFFDTVETIRERAFPSLHNLPHTNISCEGTGKNGNTYTTTTGKFEE